MGSDASKCELCKARNLEVCDVSVDTNGEFMSCDVCIRAKKGCTYANGGKGKKVGTRRTSRKKKTAGESEETPKGSGTSRKTKKVAASGGGPSPRTIAEVVVPEVGSAKKPGKPRQKSPSPSSPPRKKARTEVPPPPKSSTSKTAVSRERPESKIHRRVSSRTIEGAPSHAPRSPDHASLPMARSSQVQDVAPSPDYMQGEDSMQGKKYIMLKRRNCAENI